MDYAHSFAISRTGMALEKLRLDLSAANIANMNNAAAPGAPVYQAMTVVSKATAASLQNQFQTQWRAAVAGVGVETLAASSLAARVASEPGHPYADAAGNVRYPNISHSGEIINMMSALRTYEANLTAFSIARNMASKAIEIGGQS